MISAPFVTYYCIDIRTNVRINLFQRMLGLISTRHMDLGNNFAEDFRAIKKISYLVDISHFGITLKSFPQLERTFITLYFT